MAVQTDARAYGVAVLCGGDSQEREISLESGRSVASALGERGHRVRLVDTAKVPIEAALFEGVDVAWLALHGRGGEDGEIQERLDRLGIAYTGSGARASRLAFSKSAAKERFLQAGVPTPDYRVVHESDDPARWTTLGARLGFPLVAKPDAQGSSLGVTLVETADRLPQALSECFRYGAFGLLERAVLGAEWTVGLLDDEPLPPIRIESPRTVFDFAAKYVDEATGYRFDADAAGTAAVVEAARGACAAIGTRGLARVDLRVDAAGQPWVLEVNTIPGTTGHSLVPKAAEHAGLSLGELCERAIERALEHDAVGARWQALGREYRLDRGDVVGTLRVPFLASQHVLFLGPQQDLRSNTSNS
jgi:D-alanine-D-alanine ligase